MKEKSYAEIGGGGKPRVKLLWILQRLNVLK